MPLLRYVSSAFTEEQPETPGAPEFVADDPMVDRWKAHSDAMNAFEILKQKRIRELQGSAPGDFLDESQSTNGVSGSSKRKTPKFVPSIAQIGDAVGLQEAGRNFVVNTNLSNSELWCKDPRHPTGIPLPKETHPAIQLAFNARYINVHLEDKGTVDKPSENVLWDADFGKEVSLKEITSKTMPEGGDKIEMDLICPPPGDSHRYELTVSGQDHRAKPPKGRNRGLEETVMFEGEILRPGSSAKQRRPPGGGPDYGSVMAPGSISIRRGPFIECVPSPLLLLPPPSLPVQCSKQQQGSASALQQKMLRVAAFL